MTIPIEVSKAQLYIPGFGCENRIFPVIHNFDKSHTQIAASQMKCDRIFLVESVSHRGMYDFL